ncbi:hypothetical protein ACIBF7_27305 [Nonomuraea sp. NPDC050478]|uniref:hypothetical protein n=1 Tax=Nonomuraea sp. NPDC050478 TaxID=3364365 RepID=UPI003799F4EB
MQLVAHVAFPVGAAEDGDDAGMAFLDPPGERERGEVLLEGGGEPDVRPADEARQRSRKRAQEPRSLRSLAIVSWGCRWTPRRTVSSYAASAAGRSPWSAAANSHSPAKAVCGSPPCTHW